MPKPVNHAEKVQKPVEIKPDTPKTDFNAALTLVAGEIGWNAPNSSESCSRHPGKKACQ